MGSIERCRVAFAPRGDGESVILQELKLAKVQVDAALYYLSNDLLIDALAYLAAETRVKVRILVDEEMARPAHRPTLNRLNACGAEILVEELPGSGKLHLKTVVIDKKTVVTGSANWTETAFDANCEDTVVLRSPRLAAFYLQKFDALSEHLTLLESESAEPNPPDKFPDAPKASRHRKDLRIVAPRVQVFADVRSAEAFITPGRDGVNRLLALIKGATRSIDIGIYYLSDTEVVKALCDAVRGRPVKVRVVADDTMLTGDRLAYLQQMHEAGVSMYYLEKSSASLHLKTAVIDQQLVVTGSHNWTPSAAAKNVEDMLFLSSRTLAQYYLSYLEYLIKNHATEYANIERESAAQEAEQGPVTIGLRRPGVIEPGENLPKTGPRRDYRSLGKAPPQESLEVEAAVEYLDDGEYLTVLKDLIGSAKQSVVISMYHLSAGSRSPTSHQLLEVLGDAAERGIYVYLLLNMPMNQSDSQHESHSRVAEELRARGVDVRLGVPGLTIHRKVVVVDHAKILIGSHNWSEGALNGRGVYESSALLVLEKQDLRFAREILKTPVVSDMRSREKWEKELSVLRHLAALDGAEREVFIRRLEGGGR